jgi:signal transduction histidine kinase
MGAIASLVFLAALALVTRTVVRSVTISDIDDDIDTLAVAIGSDLELAGLSALESSPLHAGVEKNTMAFRLEHHSALLLDRGAIVAVAGDLIHRPDAQAAQRLGQHSERPFTTFEPFSGQRRQSRFRVLRLSGAARGATLIVFRSIEPTLLMFHRLDLALAAIVLLGVAGSAAILAHAVRRALVPVETVTRIAESTEAADLSRRIEQPSGGGEEVEHLTRVINSLFERLQRAFESQRRLVSDAAHELKTPAAAILAEAQEALRADTPDDQRARLLESIARSARELARETDSLLTLARGDSPRRDWQATDVRELVEHAVALLARRGTIATSFDGDLVIDAQAAMLERAIANLVLNAVSYTAEDTAVEVSAMGSASDVTITVSDRGPGIAPEDRDRIFEPFVRLPHARKSTPEGSGLGLAIVAQSVRNHRGEVTVTDREGGGAVFMVRLPRRA